MKSYQLLILLSLINIEIAIAQCNFSTTYTSTTNSFDWRTPNSPYQYTFFENLDNVHYKQYNITSPFYSNLANNNYNIRAFWAPLTKDYDPSDGWELIHYNFGDLTTATTKIDQLPKFPYIILYNRFTSIIRVFYFVEKFKGSNTARVFITFDGSHQSAVLSASVAVKSPLHQFDNNISLELPNEFSNAPDGSPDNVWLHADFPTLYDPCGCNTIQTFKIGIDLADKSIINWQTVGTQTTEQPVTDANGLQTVSDGEKSSVGVQTIGTGTNVIKTGAKYFEDYNTMKDKYEGSEFQKFLTDKKVDEKIAKAFESGVLKKIAKAGEALPIIGSAISLVDSFIGLLDGSDDGGEPAALVPATYYVNLTTTGTISRPTVNNANSIRVPGSATQNDLSTITPFYNLPLGVMNVIESPVVEYAQYVGNWYIQDVTNCPIATVLGFADLVIREYHIKDDLKYVINPYSGLELVDIQSSLYFKHNFNDFISISYDQNNANQDKFKPLSLNPNLYVASNPNSASGSGLIQTTPFMPLNCLKNNSSVLSFYTGQNPDIWVKVVASFKKSGSTDGKIYTHVNSYKVNTFVSSNVLKNYYVGISALYPIDMPNGGCESTIYRYYITSIDGRTFSSYNILASITLANTSINQSSYSAASDINIQSGNTIPNPNQSIKFFSPDISITGEFTSGNEMVFQDLDYKDPVFSYCGGTSISPQASVTFCNDAVYMAQTNSAPSSRQESIANASNSILPKPIATLSAHPNPVWTSTTLSYKVAEKGSVKLYITNGMGVKLAEVVSNPAHEAGEFQIEYSNSSLASGMYIVVLEAEGVKETIMLAVVR